MNIMNKLRDYKVTAFTGEPSIKMAIAGYAINSLRVSVYEGQKRTTIDDPTDANFVIKIASSQFGIIDNSLEVTNTNILSSLRQNNSISDDDLLLFAKAYLIDEDPFIIKQEKITRIIDCPEFQTWSKDPKTLAMYPNDGITELMTTWVLTSGLFNHQLVKDHNRIQEILSTFFNPSDATVGESVANLGVRRDAGGALRLVLFDMGSIIVKVEGVPVPCTCGIGHLVYVPIMLSPENMTKQNIKEIMYSGGSGFYGCVNNPGCQNTITANTYRSRNIDTKDSVVFERFLNTTVLTNKIYIDMLAMNANYFMPNRIGLSKTEFYHELANSAPGAFGIVQSSGKKFNMMYDNYVMKTWAILVQNVHSNFSKFIHNPDVQVAITSGRLSYAAYKQSITQALVADGIPQQCEALMSKLASMNYLGSIVDITKRNNVDITFNDIFVIEDPNSFISVLGAYATMYGAQDIQLLHSQLKQ
ncbi:MAG: hypothetical protein ACRC92_20710 [Peptostreptococcaceae bacterium]